MKCHAEVTVARRDVCGNAPGVLAMAFHRIFTRAGVGSEPPPNPTPGGGNGRPQDAAYPGVAGRAPTQLGTTDGDIATWIHGHGLATSESTQG